MRYRHHRQTAFIHSYFNKKEEKLRLNDGIFRQLKRKSIKYLGLVSSFLTRAILLHQINLGRHFIETLCPLFDADFDLLII